VTADATAEEAAARFLLKRVFRSFARNFSVVFAGLDPAIHLFA